MPLPTIFCPECNTLILDTSICHKCSWIRPQPDADGEISWAAALETPLIRNRSGSGTRPLEHNGIVFVPTEKGSIFAINATADNNIQWRYRMDKNYHCDSLAVWNDTIVCGGEYGGTLLEETQGNLVGIDVQSGIEQWRIPLDGASISTPVIHNDIAYLTVNTNILYAINLREQDILWERPLPSNWLWSPNAPAIETKNDTVIIPGRSNSVLAYQARNGKRLWQFSGGGWFPHSPVVIDSVAYLRCWDRKIYALDARTGQEIWHYPAPRDFSSDIWVDTDFLHIGVKEKEPKTYALHIIDRRTGAFVWKYQVAGHIFSRPITAGNIAFIATDERTYNAPDGGSIYALDITQQKLLWTTSVHERFQSDLTVSQNNLIAATRQGVVYALSFGVDDIVIQPPRVYLDNNEFEDAAIAFALQGEYIAAAKIYEEKLNHPFRAGQLYMLGNTPEDVIRLLGKSEKEAERDLAIEAVKKLPAGENQAEAFARMGAHRRAAEIYLKIGKPELAGEQFKTIKAWDEAIQTYKNAGLEEKLRSLLERLEKWDELISMYLRTKNFPGVATIYSQQGDYLQAGKYYNLAGNPKLAVEAFGEIPEAEQLSENEHRLVADLAREMKNWEMAISHYSRGQQYAIAAEIAREHLKNDNRALELYRLSGDTVNTAETLERLGQFVKAAQLFKKCKKEFRAGNCLLQQIEQKVQAEGGAKYLQNDSELIEWLTDAICILEKEIAFSNNPTDIKDYRAKIENCTITLAQVRAEPMYKISINATPLVFQEGTPIQFSVINKGWGTTPSLTVNVIGDYVKPVKGQFIGLLKPTQSFNSSFNIVPTLHGNVQFKLSLHNKKGDAVYTSTPYNFSVIPSKDVLNKLIEQGESSVINIKIDKYSVRGIEISDAAIVNRGNFGTAGSSEPDNIYDTGITSKAAVEQHLKSRRNEEQYCPACNRSITELLKSYPDAQRCMHCGALLHPDD